jgi:D-alanine-D-alanine ligase
MLQEFQDIRIMVLCGGKSSEREISLNSGRGVYDALNEEGYNAKLIDVADFDLLFDVIKTPSCIFFNCLHGKGGEDGEIQGLLEFFNLKYTGSGILSSALCINKIYTKDIYLKNDIPTPKYQNLTKGNLDSRTVFDFFNGNVIVKSPNEGSSIGVYIPSDYVEFQRSIESAFELDDEVLIEQFIEGKEYTVAVLNIHGVDEALPVIEIKPKNNTYDFESKYAPGGSIHVCPAQLDEELSDQMIAYALKAHKVLNCDGVSRTDFIIDSNNYIWALETNTIPGMTKTSLLPDAAKAKGYSYLQVCEFLLLNALSK